MKRISVSVGELTELCRGGDINFRFSSRSSASEGVRGHQKVQKSRGKSYIAEHPLSIEIRSAGSVIEVGGRLDGCGFDETHQTLYVEEIKTLRIETEDIPAGVLDSYWHQVFLYGYLVARECGLDNLVLRLCLYHLDRKSEHILEQFVSFEDLAARFFDTVNFLSVLVENRQRWINERDESLQKLEFPYGGFRAGQRDLAVSVYRAVADSGQLVVEAPTGIGKTMATLFPALRALGASEAERVFYLSAKTSTQVLAQDAMADITAADSKARSVILTAKEKICFSPGQPCHPDHCKYARGYYDRVHETVDTMLVQRMHFDRESIESAARDTGICPFELGLDLSRSCDVIIADYNYVFDPVVYLRRYFDNNRRDSIALVDEAHNLVDRGRDMFSAEVIKEDYLSIARAFKVLSAGVAKAARKVNQSILDFRKQDREGFAAHGNVTDNELPSNIIDALQAFCSAAEEELRKEVFGGHRDELLQCYFDSLRFVRTSENFSDDYHVLLIRDRKLHRLKLYCVDPSAQLADAFGRLNASVCFSATLQPSGYFRKMIGASDSAKWYRLPSPFPPEHLQVSVAGFIDTSWRGRNNSIPSLVQLIYKVITAKAGNYLVFFPSHDYLRTALVAFELEYPGCDITAQERTMDDEARQAFLGNFSPESNLCGFAVMGGIFSEGVDLKGNRLIGAIVVGVGLPQIGIERDLIRDHFPDNGFEYAYQFPGLVRVLQTAGRVIRGEQDRGIICLVDRRYQENRYLEQLPVDWAPSLCASSEEVARNLELFWAP